MELIISNNPAVSSLSKASGRSLSMSSTAIRLLNLLKTGRTSSDFVVEEHAIWFFIELTSLTKHGFPVEATFPQMPRSNGMLRQPCPP